MNTAVALHLFLDSNVLIGWNATLTGTAARDFLALVKQVGASVHIPEVVLMETVYNRAANTLELLSRAKNSLNEAARIVDSIAVPGELERLPSLENLRAKVDDRLKGEIVRNHLLVVPIPQIDTKELTRMAVQRIPPFKPDTDKEKKKDEGFRDTVMFVSIVEAIERGQLQPAILVTEDRFLQSPTVSNEIRRRGVTLEVVSFEVAKEKLVDHLSNQEQEVRHRREEKLKQFVLLHHEEVEAFVSNSNNFRFSQQMLESYLPTHLRFAKVIRIDGVTLKEIESIVAALGANESYEVTCESVFRVFVQLEFLMVVPRALPIPLVVGETAPLEGRITFGGPPPEKRATQSTIDYLMVLELRVRMEDQEGHRGLEIIAAREKDPLFASILHSLG